MRHISLQSGGLLVPRRTLPPRPLTGPRGPRICPRNLSPKNRGGNRGFQGRRHPLKTARTAGSDRPPARCRPAAAAPEARHRRPRLRPRQVPARAPPAGHRLGDRPRTREVGLVIRTRRRRTEHGSGLGRARWVVERTFAWLHHSSACSSATTAAPRSMRLSSRSAAASSASGRCRTHSDSSSLNTRPEPSTRPGSRPPARHAYYQLLRTATAPTRPGRPARRRSPRRA